MPESFSGLLRGQKEVIVLAALPSVLPSGSAFDGIAGIRIPSESVDTSAD